MCLKNIFIVFLLLLSFLVAPLYSSSRTELTTVIQSLKVDTQLLRVQISNYEKQIASLSIIINNLETSNSDQQSLSLMDKQLLESSKQDLETVKVQLTESKAELIRLNKLLASYSVKIKSRNKIIVGVSLIAIAEGVYIWVKNSLE